MKVKQILYVAVCAVLTVVFKNIDILAYTFGILTILIIISVITGSVVCVFKGTK